MAESSSYIAKGVYDMNGSDFFTECNLQPEKVLANAMYGKIVLAIPLEKPHKRRVVKVFRDLDQEKNVRNVKIFLNEVRIMQSLDHPFIMKCIIAGYCYHHMAICMKYYERGTLSRHVGGLSYQLSELYVTQVACALRYMHKNNVVHLDVKLGNIFIDSNNNAVLGDFGLAVEMSPDQKTLVRRRCGGTQCYYAPELIEASADKELDPYKLDSFCLGVVLWSLVTMKKPDRKIDYFQDASSRQDLPSNIRNWLLKLLARDPSSRLTITDLLTSVRLESCYREIIDNF